MFSLKRNIGIFILLLGINNLTFSVKPLPKNICITKDEYRLIELINAYRLENDMPTIGISKSLTHVAHLHITDLNKNHPDTSICNLHSWSDKGDWTAGCYQAYVPNQNIMWNKPKELTPYKYRGYELAYWEQDSISPDSLLAQWLDVPEARDMLLNKGNYKKKKWFAIGSGIKNGYAVVWFGQVKDKLKPPSICEKGKPNITIPKKIKKRILIVKKKTGRYYIIFGSFKTQKEAAVKLKKYISKGFMDAKIVINRNKIRISLSDHENLDKAKRAKFKLDKKYSDAWIIKY